jgi:O-antigen/teichoic acid export membrane protein
LLNPNATPAGAHPVVAALRWSYIGFFVRAILQFVAQVVLARHAGPAAFGQYALMLLAVGGLYVLGEGGVSSTIVRTEAGDRAERAVLQGQVLICAALLGGLAAVAAGLLPDALLATPVQRRAMQLMALGLGAQVAGAWALGALRKALRFKAIQGSQALGIVAGFALAVPVAWGVDPLLGLATYWSAQQLVICGLNYVQARGELVAPDFRLARLARASRGFALNATATNIVNWGLENLDGMMIGRVAGAHALGLYSTAYTLVRYPTNLLVNAAQAVAFPASTMYRDDPRTLAWGHQRAVFLISMLMLPLFAAASLVAEGLVRLVYGPAWLPAASALAVLALAMPLHALTAITGPILWGTGRVHLELRVQVITLFALAVLLAACAGLPIVVIAFVVLAAYALRAALLCRALYEVLGASPVALVRVALPGVAATVLALAVGHALRVALSDAPLLAAQGAALGAFALTWILLVRGFAMPVRDEAFRGHWGWLAGGLAARLPALARKELR